MCSCNGEINVEDHGHASQVVKIPNDVRWRFGDADLAAEVFCGTLDNNLLPK